jgi:hypothetical protein
MASQLDKLKRIAKTRNKQATVEYNAQQGYFLLLPNKKIPLGKDSVDALFMVEKLLGQI